MLNRLIAFDNWAIDRAEDFANYIQYWTGLNCFKLARICWAIYAACSLYNIVTTRGSWVFESMAMFYGVRCAFYGSFGNDNFEKYAESMSEGRFGNPNRFQWFDRVIRLMTTPLAAFGLFHLLARIAFELSDRSANDLQVVAFFGALIFSACSPQPPCRGRLWQRAARQELAVVQGRS